MVAYDYLLLLVAVHPFLPCRRCEREENEMRGIEREKLAPVDVKEMTPEERQAELAEILARGVRRIFGERVPCLYASLKVLSPLSEERSDLSE